MLIRVIKNCVESGAVFLRGWSGNVDEKIGRALVERGLALALDEDELETAMLQAPERAVGVRERKKNAR